MKNHKWLHRLGLPVAALAAMPAQQAIAQQPAGDAVDPQEIIVTARKRNERLLDVPVAVSALSRAQLERYATSSLNAVAQQTPQLVIGESQNPGGGSINLRGVGAGTSNPSSDQAVSLNLDGVQVSNGNAVRLGEYDLQRVEVLKGPQALFYGKNSPGGVISLVSSDPGKNFEGQVRAGYETEARQRFIEGIVSGPLTENIGARVVGYYGKEKGWFRNLALSIPGQNGGPAAKSNNSEDKFVRGTLLFNSPAQDLTVKLKVSYGDTSRNHAGPGSTGQLRYCPLGGSQLPGGTVDCRVDRYFTSTAITPAAAAVDPSFGDGQPYLRSNQLLGSLAIDYDLNDQFKLSSVTGYYRLRERTFDNFTWSNYPAVMASNRVSNKSFTQELRLASDLDGPFNFLVGGFYQKADFSIRNAVLLTIPPAGTLSFQPVAVNHQDTRSYSIFGQVRYKFDEKLELSAGGRYSRERKALNGTLNGTVYETSRPKRRFKDFSPDITLSFKPERDLTLYASYKEGFTSGGYNTGAFGQLRSAAFPAAPIRDLSFEQVTVRGGELGFKGYAFDRQLRFDLTGYHYKYKGLQLTSSIASPTAATIQLTTNAGGAKVRGLEANLVLMPRSLEGLELRTALAYNKADYTDFIGGCYSGQTVALGCNLIPRNAAADPSTFGTAANPYTAQDQGGQQITRAPKWSVSTGFSYERSLTDDIGGSVAFDGFYTSSYMPQIEANPLIRQACYWQLNGNVSIYGGDDRAWQLSLIGRNLTNRLVAVQVSTVGLTGTGSGTVTARSADLFAVVGEPRSVLLQLTLKSSLLSGR